MIASVVEELVRRIDDGLARAATRDEHIRWAAVRSLVEQLLVTRPAPDDGRGDAGGQRSTARTG